MKTNPSRLKIKLSAFCALFFLSNCSAPQGSIDGVQYSMGESYPADLFFKRFPPRTDSIYLTATEATVKIAREDCVDLGELRVIGAVGNSLDFEDGRSDMDMTARQLDGLLSNRGGNAYVIDSYAWIRASNPNSTQLAVDVQALLCS
jgi:hypothetical protein